MPETFRDRSFRFSLDILRYYRTILRTTDVPRHVVTQLLRAGTAIGANLEEAVSASSRRDLAAKNSIALREARECHYWLRLIKADQAGLAPGTDQLLDDCQQLIALLASAVRRLRLNATLQILYFVLCTSYFVLVTVLVAS
jgi:four helix bundle protein